MDCAHLPDRLGCHLAGFSLGRGTMARKPRVRAPTPAEIEQARKDFEAQGRKPTLLPPQDAQRRVKTRWHYEQVKR